MKDDTSSRSPSFYMNDHYIAGLIDMGGSLSLMSRGHGVPKSPVVQIKLPDEEVVKEIQDYFGGVGTIYTELRPKARTVYRWRVSGSVAQDLLNRLYPLLLIKRDRADELLAIEIKNRRPVEKILK